MRRARVTLLAVTGFVSASFLLGASAGAETLSPRAQQKLVERTQASVVRIVSLPAATGVLIGVGGELLAPLPCAKGDAVAVEVRGEALPARVVKRDPELGLVLLALQAGDYPAAAVGSSLALLPGSFLMGLSFDRAGRLAPSPGHLRRAAPSAGKGSRLSTDVAGPPGTALFNARGELVALHAAPSRLTTIPIEEIRARFTDGATP